MLTGRTLVVFGLVLVGGYILSSPLPAVSSRLLTYHILGRFLFIILFYRALSLFMIWRICVCMER